jgi:uncharacterized protein YhaN
MKIVKLELERYGRFSGQVLEFRQDAHLHVVYGANEAGKTTALSAITDMFYGVPTRTNYGFLHPYSTLMLGATIINRADNTLSFKRKKGQSKTLLSSQGTVLPDDALAPFLGLINRPVFENAWGLSKETLTLGAQEMLKSGGEAGISLFAAASGIKGLMDIKKQLETEASGIFATTKAKDRTFYQALSRFEDAATKVRELGLLARDFKDRRKAIVDFNAELEVVRSSRATAIKSREALVRLREIAPVLKLIAMDEGQLGQWQHLPALESSLVRQLRVALDQCAEAQRELTRLQGEESEAKKVVEGLVVDEMVLTLGPAIRTLIQGLTNYQSEKSQRSRVQGEADSFKYKLQDAAIRLGLPADSNLESLRPDAMLVTRVKAQIKAGEEISSSLKVNADAIALEKGKLGNVKKQQAANTSASDPKPLQDQLGRLMPALRELDEIARLTRSTAKESTLIKEKAAQLSPSVTDLGALALASLPTKDVIDEYRKIKETLEGDRKTLQGSLKETEQNLPGQQSKVDELSGGELASSPDKIKAVRLDRDSHWVPLKAALLHESERLSVEDTTAHVVGLEIGIGTADRLADDAVQHADRLANYDTALKIFDAAKLKQDNLTGLLSLKDEEIEAQEHKWQAIWQPLGLLADIPIRMSNWVGQVGDLLERRTKNLEELEQLRQLDAGITAIRPLLHQIANAVEIAECEELPVDVLLDAVDDKLTLRADAWQASRDLVTRLTTAEEQIESLEKEKARQLANETKWKASWNEILMAMRLPPETTVDEAAAALDIWNQVPHFLEEQQNRLKRVEGMDRDTKQFEAQTSTLMTQLSAPDLGFGFEVMVNSLEKQLLEAEKIHTKAAMAQDRLFDLKELVRQAEGKAGDAAGELELLCEVLPPSSNRSQQVLELEARETVLERLRERRETLVPLSRGQSEEEIRQALELFDEAGAVAEIEAQKAKEEQFNKRENEVYASLTHAQDELAKLEGGVGAEIAVQLRKNAEAELIESTRAWAVKRFAQILLSYAIEQHRSHQEQPLLKKASQLFALLTANSFVGVEQETDDKDVVHLVGRRDANHTVDLTAMSEGTTFQLYLALRLAYLDEYAQNAEPMPFIGDDLLTSFDDERTRRGITALAEIGTRIQPILFTHHSRVVELAREELGDRVDVVNLD